MYTHMFFANEDVPKLVLSVDHKCAGEKKVKTKILVRLVNWYLFYPNIGNRIPQNVAVFPYPRYIHIFTPQVSVQIA